MGLFSGFLGSGTASDIEPIQRVKEIIGRARIATTNFWRVIRSYYSVDTTKTDYQWWDKFRRGKQAGYEFSGLFAKPITEILASWVMGEMIEPRLVDQDDYTDNLLQKFFKRVHGTLVNLVIDLYALGDQYIIINPDGSLSIPSPDLVEVAYDPLDYRRMVKVTITSRLEQATVTDEYRLDGRTVTIKWQTRERKDTETFTYQNLIGKLPVVHLANDRSGNETNGRPVYESLQHLYDRYNNLVEKMVDGAELMGNPIPTFEGIDSIDAFLAANQTSPVDTFYNENNVEQEHVQIDFDNLPAIITGAGGKFKFSSPGNGFTDDVRNTLKTLFVLVMEHTRIPEAVWGLELSSARATAIEQMKTFHMYIWQKRWQLQGQGADADLGMEAKGGLLELCDIWLRMRAITDRRVKVAPVTLKWSELAQMDEQLKYQKTESAHNKGVITDETYLKNLDIVEDVEKEVADANDQMQDDGDRFDQDVEDALNEAA